MSALLNAKEKMRTTEVPDNKRKALLKLLSRVFEITSRQADQVLVQAFGARTLNSFTYGDVFDLANTSILESALHQADITVPKLLVSRAYKMIALISEKIEPCENTRCGEFPIYELGGVVRAS